MPSVEYEYDDLTLVVAEIEPVDESFSTPVGLQSSTGYEIKEISIVIWNWGLDTDITKALSESRLNYFKEWTLEKYFSLLDNP